MKDNAPNLLALVGSAIGGASCVVAFTFMTFQSKSEAQQVEQNHVQRQQDTQSEIHDLRASIDKLNDKVDVLLQRAK